jgi:two-component system LytT family response regulator
MPRALIIDDEELARDELRRLLAAHPDFEIAGEADAVPAARVRLAQHDYELVLLDIQLAGGSGFDLVPHVAPAAEIVFVTAHDRFAVRAFEVNALDYLLKPVSPARLASTLARVTRLTARATADVVAPRVGQASTASPFPPPGSSGDPFDRPLAPLVRTDSIFLKNERGARFVPLTAISAVTSCDNYSEVFVEDARYLVRRSLKTWENALPAELFARVHRQAIINLALIERILGFDTEKPSLHLRGMKAAVACSHRLSPELRRRLAGHVR